MDANPKTSDVSLTLKYTLAVGAIAALYRLAPYYLLPSGAHLLWNLAPVGALALFAGARLRTSHAFLVPLGAMLLSDLLLIAPLKALGYSAFTWDAPITYASFAAYVLIGRLIQQDERSPMVIGGAALLAGLQFFLFTNFAAWLNSPLYPRTLGGLLECYAAGVPFYRHTLAGDLFFSAMIFGAHAVLVAASRPQKASQPA